MGDLAKVIEFGVKSTILAGEGVVKVASMIDRAPSSSKDSSSAQPSSSAPSSSKDYKYKPSESDLVYLLHDDDESDNPQEYIVDNLTEYGTNCIPLKVYVSVLLRTWETALLLYLPFLYNKDKPEYSQTLILEISPFLLEEKKAFDLITYNSNLGLDFAGNVNQFFNFIKLLIFLKNDKTLNTYLTSFPNNFTIILVAGVEKVYLRINVKASKVEYYLPSPSPSPNSASIDFDNKGVVIPNKVVTKIVSDITSKIIPKIHTYEKYNSSTTPPVLVRTIYTQFSMTEGFSADFHNFESIGKYRNDMFAFLKWVIENKSHPKNIPILFVSHSGTMRNFLKMLISNLHYNYTDLSHAKDYYPSDEFYNVCKNVESKNTWSMRFKYLGYNVTGFRHAQSCDNMYKTIDKPTKVKQYTTGAIERNKLGKYTNLSLWGIFSTLIFISANVHVISDFVELSKCSAGLMVLDGMPQQSLSQINMFGMNNELTCGDVTARFHLSSRTTPSLNVSVIQTETFVDIIPQSTPLYEYLSGNTKQLALNYLSTLDNIFYIEFKDCNSSGCNFSVSYCGVIMYLQGVSGMKIDKIDRLLRERKVNINIDIDLDIPGGEYVLTLTNVNPGGLVIDKAGEQKINYLFKDEAPIVFKDNHVSIAQFDSNQKIKISDDFQRSVGFLLGFDIIKSEKSDIEVYTILYNIIILYSNLLIRQLLTTHLLVTSYQPSTLYLSQNDTKNFLEKGTAGLYGGKNHEKRKKNKKHKKHNNPKK